ncbi:hypothetical protein HanRHA438_Chr11g0500531 [Helianthus annuus]|nr:hypothetical protein HanIR_Chr11g0524921 [Helianthus annuus]KAJ0870442.1 hypothetical protein HanRHA438_Chr11g0500531 [Helianthus annuus]
MAIAYLNHVTIWIMEEELVHLHTPFFYNRGHIFDSHFLEFLDYEIHICALKRNVVVFWIDHCFLCWS